MIIEINENSVILAFSGGLDTSYCAVYLTQIKQLQVHAVTINTGGFSDRDIEILEEKAYALGAKTFVCIDVRNQFYESCIKYMIFGNVLKNATYPLSVSSERVIQALAIADYANKLGVKKIAHGSTGAGNDQVRFDMIFTQKVAGVTILTPIREQQLSREEEVNFLNQYGVKIDDKVTKYSINKGLWGTSVGGFETLTSSDYLPEEAWPTPVSADDPMEIVLSFYRGELVGLNGEKFIKSIDIIEQLQRIAQPFGIGRDIHVGDTIIGIKGRVGFEAAAPIIIIKAHQLLEKHVLTKGQLALKDQLAMWYGNSLHDGNMLDPAMRNIESFFTDSQEMVSGDVYITLYPYRFVLKGIYSTHDLMSPEFGKYGEMNFGWTANDVKGFTKLLGHQISIYHQINIRKEND